MELMITRVEGAPVGTRPVEIVERKGLGHPDTMCDALADSLRTSSGFRRQGKTEYVHGHAPT